MAKKKTAVEPQEEQNQVPDLSGEGIGDEAAIPVEGSAPEGGDGGGEPADFPAADEPPFEDTQEGEVPPEGDAPAQPPDVDGMSLNGDAAGVGGAEGEPAMEDKDYDAFLAEVGQGGMEPVPLPDDADSGGEPGEDGGDPPVAPEDYTGGPSPASDVDAPNAAGAPARVIDRRSNPRRERERVLTIDPHAEVLTQQDLEDIVWHELENAQRTGRILTGKLVGVERTRNGMDTAVVLFKNMKVLVPLKEMAVHTGQVPSGPEYAAWASGIIRILSTRQNSDVDFLVRGLGSNEAGERIVAGSRRDAMRRKRKHFYLDTDELGRHMIEEGSMVQARVVAVADKLIRLEVFGVECAVAAKRMSWVWMSSARDKHYVGELIPVRVTQIERVNADRITIRVDARDVFGETGDNLSLCQRNGRYVGEVTDVRKGVIFIRLSIGVNAVSHECRDMRIPGRKDTVSFTVTRLDEKNGVAIGVVNRIIKQNL